MLTTSRLAIRTHYFRKAAILKQWIARYYNQLSPNDQEEIKRTLLKSEPPRKVIAPAHIVPLTNQSAIPNWPFPKDKVWQLKILVGDDLFDEAIKKNGGLLTGHLVIDLIKKLSIPYYVSEDKQCLTVGTNELTERNFGPLTPISAIDALQRFGLAGLEEAIERGSVCI